MYWGEGHIDVYNRELQTYQMVNPQTEVEEAFQYRDTSQSIVSIILRRYRQ